MSAVASPVLDHRTGFASAHDQRAIGSTVDQLHSHAVDGRSPTGQIRASRNADGTQLACRREARGLRETLSSTAGEKKQDNDIGQARSTH